MWPRTHRPFLFTSKGKFYLLWNYKGCGYLLALLEFPTFRDTFQERQWRSMKIKQQSDIQLALIQHPQSDWFLSRFHYTLTFFPRQQGRRTKWNPTLKSMPSVSLIMMPTATFTRLRLTPFQSLFNGIFPFLLGKPRASPCRYDSFCIRMSCYLHNV
jgi:hypothetical protein